MAEVKGWAVLWPPSRPHGLCTHRGQGLGRAHSRCSSGPNRTSSPDRGDPCCAQEQQKGMRRGEGQTTQVKSQAQQSQQWWINTSLCRARCQGQGAPATKPGRPCLPGACTPMGNQTLNGFV